MNNDTTTIDQRPIQTNSTSETTTGRDAQLDEELRWTCLKVLALLGDQPPTKGLNNPRQMLLYAANKYQGSQPARFDHLCHGLYLTSERRFREALGEFEVVLSGQVEPEFEIFRELALETHATCLEQLDYDELALEEFTRLLHRKFEETRDRGEADHVAKLLGLARLEGRSESQAPIWR